jgi:UPF0755 protein
MGTIFIRGFRPVGGAPLALTITEGESQIKIANDLKRHKIIRSVPNFLIALIATQNKIKPGTYTLDPSNNLFKIVKVLAEGQNQLIRLTIPEGWRKEQIADKLTGLGLDGQGFLTLVASKEGYLFPDTYFFAKEATRETVVETLGKNFTARTKDLNITSQQLILASIVEREAKRDDERALIAGIYQNRISHNMPLEADPTVQYAKDSNALANGKKLESFWQPITLAEYTSVISPYNTYLNPGFPPGPICNPGMKSIQAALEPKATDALYFFHTAKGDIITSLTIDEHRAKVKQYLQ